MSVTHELKTWPEYFLPVIKGKKRFEIRKNDREFQVGDKVWLKEWDPKRECFTGMAVKFDITYITDFGQPKGQIVMGIELSNV